MAIKDNFFDKKQKLLNSFQKKFKSNQTISLTKYNKSEHVKLSLQQERLWFVFKLEQNNTNKFHIPCIIELNGKLNRKALQSALDKVVKRHEALRTCFIEKDNQTFQYVRANLKIKIKCHTSSLEQQDKKDQYKDLIKSSIMKPFDLLNGPLFRVDLYQLDNNQHFLVLVFQHIILDGWSLDIVLSELAVLYNAQLTKTNHDLPAALQYGDYSLWQGRWLDNKKIENQLSYWENQLKSISKLNLPLDKPRPLMQSYEGDLLFFKIDQKLTAQLNQLSIKNNATLFIILVAVYKLLLSLYSNQSDICIGTTLANRNQQETENIVGFFANLVVLRTNLHNIFSFEKLIELVKETILGAYDNQDVSFHQVVERLQPVRDQSSSPLFQVNFVLQNTRNVTHRLAKNKSIESIFNGLQIKVHNDFYKASQYDLSFFLETTNNYLEGYVVYNINLFKENTIKLMIEQYINLLESAVMENHKIFSLYTIPERHYSQLLKWQSGKSPKLIPYSIQEEFLIQVKSTPDSIAIKFANDSLTYQQLNERANKLTHYLRTRGVINGGIVGICLERSLDMVVAILAVVKAGGIYVPLDPAYPEDRLLTLLEDASINTILSNSICLENLPMFQLSFIDVICIDEHVHLIDLQPYSELQTNSSPLDIAYLIYTSGTTKKPKGVMVSHQSILRLVKQPNYVNITQNDIFLNISPVSFDASIFEIWGALLNGACLVLPQPGLKALDQIGKIINSEAITVLWLTAGLFNAIVDNYLENISNVKQLLCGGDILSVKHVNKAANGLKNGVIINGYGPTETTTFACTYTLSSINVNNYSNTIPIGTPINYTSVCILDKQLNILPIGAVGELFIAGKGLAYGYLNQPELTAENFLANCFSTEYGTRMYRTGDLVRWNDYGQLEFISRIDDQIKVRGYRIEPSEIEENLLMHPEISNAIVISKEFGKHNKCLIAYWTAQSQSKSLLNSSDIRFFLKERLPTYLIPSIFIKLEQLPLTLNGKVDKKLLPDPTEQDFMIEESVIPSTENEQLMLNVWKEVLEIDNISIRSNFFELGGDSLRAIQLKVKAQEIGLEFEISQLFKYQTIEELVKNLLENQSTVSHKKFIKPFALVSENDKEMMSQDIIDAYPLSSLQLGMVYHSEYDTTSGLYHDVIGYQIALPFNQQAIESTLDYLVKRHKMLRTSFELIKFSVPMQLVHTNTKLPLYVEDISSYDENQQMKIIKININKERFNKFNWSNPPFCKLYIYKINLNKFKLIWSFHHAIIDGWSEAVLTTEFIQLYQSLLTQNIIINTEPITSSYSDYIILEQQAQNSFDNKEFWVNYLKDYKFITLSSNSVNRSLDNEVNYLAINLTNQIIEKLNDLSKILNVPLKTILLTAHQKAISVLSGVLDITTGIVMNVRPEIKDSEKMLGLFLNSLPFRMNISTINQTWRDLIMQVFSLEQEIFLHRYYPLHSIMQHTGGAPLFEILFNYTHFHIYNSLGDKLSNIIHTRDGYAVNSFPLLVDFSACPISQKLIGVLGYNKNYYTESVVKEFVRCYEEILTAITQDNNQYHQSYNFSSIVLTSEIIYNTSKDYRRLSITEKKGEIDNYLAPETDLEIDITKIWIHVLKVDKISVLDNFFEVGGHSLLIIQVHEKLKQKFLDLTIADLFKFPTIRSLAKHLNTVEHNLNWYKTIKNRRNKYIISLLKSQNDIAIIGIACRFPQAKNIQEYWNNLSQNKESITRLSKEDLLKKGIDITLIENPNYVPVQGLLEDMDMFDADFFGFTPREAELMDPQQRILLEVSYTALEDAGYVAKNYKDRIGVYIGTSINSYMFYNLSTNQNLTKSSDLFQILSVNQGSTQISYKLNLRGPSVNVSTACSSSLVAVHLACKSLLNFECEMALSGGASINCNPLPGYIYEEGGVMSFNGQCRTFDAEASGTVAGNGVGVIVLKRLTDALNDGDYIYSIIKGTAINNDGSMKVGYTAPSIQGQSEVIAEAQNVAKVSPESISYIEAHGTGTILGDPIEVAALTATFRAVTNKKSYCAIGSVKPNIGHLDAAAGIAGLIKTVLSLQHKKILPSLHFKSANPKIDFDNSPFYVNTKLSEWHTDKGIPRRAGVSSFGIGGTNAHVVLEEAPTLQHQSVLIPQSHYLLNLSAKSLPLLKEYTSNLLNTLKCTKHINIADVAYTLQVGREEFNYRRTIVCQDTKTAIQALELVKDSDSWMLKNKQPDIIFMFPGQGTQYTNMALDIYKTVPIFKNTINECAKILYPLLNINLVDVLYPKYSDISEANSLINQTWITQPALFTIEYSLACLWQTWGVKPVSMIGHSLGEYVAACIAGVITLPEALKIVTHRGRLMQSLPSGRMLTVFANIEQLLPLLTGNCSIAAINTPSSCVLSGTELALEALKQELTKQGIEAQYLKTSHAFHSYMMDPILEEYNVLLSEIKFQPPKIPYISNVNGKFINFDQKINPFYWTQHLRNTVHFTSGLQILMEQSNKIFLEVGPGCSLQKFVKAHPESTKNHVITSLPNQSKQQNSMLHLLEAVGQVWQLGIPIDWHVFNNNEKYNRLPLPTYPFKRKSYWLQHNYSNVSTNITVESSQVLLPNEEVLTPKYLRPSLQYEYVSPKSEIEQKIASVWQECFGFEKIGVQDDFFDLGGDSLLATQIASRLRDRFGLQLSMTMLFENTTISKIAEILGRLTK